MEEKSLPKNMIQTVCESLSFYTEIENLQNQEVQYYQQAQQLVGLL